MIDAVHKPLHLRRDRAGRQKENRGQNRAAELAIRHEGGRSTDRIEAKSLLSNRHDKAQAENRNQIDLENDAEDENRESQRRRWGKGSESVGENGVGHEEGVDADGGDEGAGPGVLEGGEGGFEGGALAVEGEESGGDGGEGGEEGEGVDGEEEGGAEAEEGEGIVAGLGEDVTELEAGGGVAEDGFEMEDVGFERVRGERESEEEEREREGEEEEDGEENALVSGEDLKGMEEDFEGEDEEETQRFMM